MNASFFKRFCCLNIHSTKFTSIIKSILLFFAIFVYGADSVSQTYTFSTYGNVFAANGYWEIQKIAFIIKKEGNIWKAQLSIDDSQESIFYLTSLKVSCEEGKKCIKGKGNDIEIIFSKEDLNIDTGDRLIYTEIENCDDSLKKNLTTLLVELESSSSGAQDSRKGYSLSGNNRNDDSWNKLIPSSGNLTAITFANHPFGFMRPGPLSQSEACAYLRRADWPSGPYSSSLISIISSTPFKIPFKMYGKDVSSMYMSWYNGENKGYDLEVSDYKTIWTKNDAICLAQKMYEELINNEYSDIEVRYTYSGNFYQKAVTNGTVYIQIEAHEGSKIKSWDSFEVCMNVRYEH